MHANLPLCEICKEGDSLGIERTGCMHHLSDSESCQNNNTDTPTYWSASTAVSGVTVFNMSESLSLWLSRRPFTLFM